MSIIDDILKEAESELELDKEANDANGGPETPASQSGSGDIVAVAQGLLQKIEQFKASVGETAAQNSGTPPTSDSGIDVNTGQENAAIAIVRPDGTQIKVAALLKIATLRGKKLFEEV